jgi:hypothetical protein
MDSRRDVKRARRKDSFHLDLSDVAPPGSHDTHRVRD